MVGYFTNGHLVIHHRSEMSSTELAGIASEAKKELFHPQDAETLKLIEEAVKSGVKISEDQVLRIWKIVEKEKIPGLTRSIIWIEDGNARAGYQHMLDHAAEFEELGVTKEQMTEVAEAATTVGHPGGIEGKKKPGRPIFGLYFYGQPLAVAISIGSNGFVVAMNRISYDKFLKNVKDKNVTEELMRDLHSWPKES